jgi:predicted ArsR family transcriptional regulator
MILSNLGAYLKDHKRASMGDLANRFDAEPEALRGMLARLMAKGRVRRLEGAGDCGGCRKCEAFQLEIYEWTG